MDGIVLKVRGNYVVPDVKEFLIMESTDVEKLPTTTRIGSFSIASMNELCAFGSIAYTADYSFIASLGLDDQWHEIYQNIPESYDDKPLWDAVNSKQATLVSGVNIKTVNEISLLGRGNVEIEDGTDDLIRRLESGNEEDATLHLGLYKDSEDSIVQKEG